MAERKEMETIIKLDEFPSNSHKSKEKKTEIVASKKIIKGSVRKRKPSLGKKMKDEFISTDSHSVLSYLLEDVFIPAAKETIANLVSGGVDMVLFGGSGDRSRSSTRNKTHVSYESYYERKNDRYSSRNRRATQHMDDVIFDNRTEAEDVLSALLEDIDEYGITTVGNFYDLVGERTTPSDFKWGWETLRSASVDRVREGYIIRLPRPIAVD